MQVVGCGQVLVVKVDVLEHELEYMCPVQCLFRNAEGVQAGAGGAHFDCVLTVDLLASGESLGLDGDVCWPAVGRNEALCGGRELSRPDGDLRSALSWSSTSEVRVVRDAQIEGARGPNA